MYIYLYDSRLIIHNKTLSTRSTIYSLTFSFSLTCKIRGAAITHGAAIAHNNDTKTSQNSEICNSIPKQRKKVQANGMVN